MKMQIASKNRNRNAFPLAAALTGTLMLGGCLAPADRETGAGPGKPPAAISREEGFRILESMGYSKEKIVAKGDAFIVEGDMVYSADALARLDGQPLAKTAQRAEMAIWAIPPNLVKVAIHSSMADWAKFVHQAVNNWNAVGTRLHLEVVPSGGDITVYSDASTACPANMRNQGDNIGGQAYPVVDGKPGSAICINRDQSQHTSNLTRVATITHELGHTIGFRHTNDPTVGGHVTGSASNDLLSVMNTGSASLGIEPSYWDKFALEVLYPSDKPLGGTDLDGDRRDDIVVWSPRTSEWSCLRSSSGFTTSSSVVFGARGDLPVADMDLDGDGTDDLVMRRLFSWQARLSSTGGMQEYSAGTAMAIGNHDMDGDGRDDLVDWNWKDTTFHVLTSRSNFATKVSYKWGAIGDIPVGGINADQDNKDDFVVWRPVSRMFFVLYSASNFTTFAPFFGGQPGDIPVGGTDLDRDTRDDLTTWRPGDGNWTAITSSSDHRSKLTYQWGARGDVPLIGTDIDQDGKRDIGVWRPSIGTWYFRLSGTGFASSRSFVWGR